MMDVGLSQNITQTLVLVREFEITALPVSVWMALGVEYLSFWLSVAGAPDEVVANLNTAQVVLVMRIEVGREGADVAVVAPEAEAAARVVVVVVVVRTVATERGVGA